MCFKNDGKRLGNPNRQTLDLWPDFADIIGVGRNSVYAAARRGDFKTIRIGKKIVVSIFEVERLLAGGVALRPTGAPSLQHIDTVTPEARNGVQALIDESDPKSAEAV